MSSRSLKKGSMSFHKELGVSLKSSHLIWFVPVPPPDDLSPSS